MDENKYCISDEEFVKIAYKDFENFKQELSAIASEGQRIIDFCRIYSLKKRENIENNYDEKINILQNKLIKILKIIHYLVQY